MSGDSQRSDEHDPIDDDFVIEDLGNKADDLDPLFAPPTGPADPNAAAVPPVPPVEAKVDEEDVLFTDHTEGLQPSERFEGKPGFAEEAKSQWSGEGLELDEVGVPPVDESAEAAAAAAMAAAEATFSNELGSLLANEEEFALDSDAELELVGGEAAGDGISEFEQSGPFVLDDGEGAWQQDGATTAAGEAAESATPSAEADALPELAPVADEPVEPGWEPLPAAHVDALAEVDDVSRIDEEQGDAVPVAAGVGAGVGLAAGAAAAVGVGAADPSEAAAETGFDSEPLPAVGRAPVLIGARQSRRRSMRALLAVAAVLLMCSAAVSMLYRPQWFGITVEPERLQVVQIERPLVRVDVPPPRAPEVAAVVPPTTVPTPDGTSGNPVATVEGPRPDPTPRPDVAPPVVPVDPSVPPVEPTPGTTPTPMGNPEPTPVTVPVATEPVAVTPVPVVPVVEPSPVPPPPTDRNPTVPDGIATAPAPSASNPATDGWPRIDGPTPPSPRGGKSGTPLVRVSENLMVGDRDGATRTVTTVEGVLPGSRAFAQLRNGNYFIGSVKCAGADTVTLNVDHGEVTLATAELTRLTELGSADYEDLQKATSGFVRLTNNNRLVGGILSKIADDHIVLEFRSNRVMLPRSAVGEVVHGEGDAAIRLDVTREEDEWLRQIAERQLGTGVPPATTESPQPVGTAPVTPAAPATPSAPPSSGRPR